jgi:NAD(P)-dependent dehydrogenase (short-subunit alcohol dehydrogenase family)
MNLGLQDKHAIVTGGSRGIGKAIARELAREGADVAIVARSKADLEATARELAAETNRRIVPLAADVTSKEQVDRMVAEAAQQLGGLHILVNSGSAPGGSATATGPIETVIDEDLLQDFNVKYVGALRCSRAVIPFMKAAGWGRIINISGGNARNAGNLSGGARNAALVHMTKTLAVQLGRHGITVNCIHPGTTRTERTPSLLAARAAQLGVSPEEAERQDFAPDSPRGNAICRMVDASEIAFVAVFLASEKAWAVSGELVAASGGAGRWYITEQSKQAESRVLAHLVVADRPGEDPVTNPHRPLSLGNINQRSCPASVIAERQPRRARHRRSRHPKPRDPKGVHISRRRERPPWRGSDAPNRAGCCLRGGLYAACQSRDTSGLRRPGCNV